MSCHAVGCGAVLTETSGAAVEVRPANSDPIEAETGRLAARGAGDGGLSRIGIYVIRIG